MQTYFDFPPVPLEHPVYLAIGNFDGVHRGHQWLVGAMAEAARQEDALAGLLTFVPHPRAVLRPGLPQAALTGAEERAEVLTALGLDFVIVMPFSAEIAAWSAADFMRHVTGRLQVKELWIGPDFALGRGREGSVERLTAIGEALGYRLRVAQPFHWLGQPVRSSRIRALLETGDATKASELLGRPYRCSGVVTTGAQRGRTIGFPTANLAIPTGRLIPANGVYACWAWLGDAGHPAVVNVGVRPTFDNAHRSIEAFLLDFSGDLYGETMGLSFVARLRGEQRFASVDALIGQIQADVAAARGVLAEPLDETRAGSWKLEAGSWRVEDGGETWWQELDHTADWAIQVTADAQRQLFARAATAMYLLQDVDLTRPITLARAIQVEAGNAEELLVAWLNRLLLGQEIAGELYTRFEIHALSGRGLAGVAYGYRGTPSHTAIKAVTYHELEVSRTAQGWTATITFDV